MSRDYKGLTEIERIINKCNEIRKQLVLFLQQPKEDYDANSFVNKDPLAPIIGTICDERISADDAWKIPYSLSEWLRKDGLDFKASVICNIGREKLREWLSTHMQNKWPKKLSVKEREEWLNNISTYIVKACEKIWKEYNDDPDSMFVVNNGNLSVPLIYFVLRQFPGIGPKKASMIARDFGMNGDWFKSLKFRLQKRGINLTITNICFTEMPIDVHVRRVFRRLGFQRYNQPQDFQNLARLIYPENPGLVDTFIWRLGRKICKSYHPECGKCPLSDICEFRGKEHDHPSGKS